MFNTSKSQSQEVSFRYIKHDDSDKGLFNLLSQLTKAPHVPKDQFQEYLNLMRQSNSSHIHIVAEDNQTHQLVAFGSIIVCETLMGKVGKI